MTHQHDDDNGRFNYWVAIDVAAAALDVGIKRAYQLARTDRWRHTPTKPRGYLMTDIRRTAQHRKDAP
ncbi:hypothetical protein [Agromyces sp. SYSU T00194]|uniref:hypothetical protein n=1 Tax=Agromyces chitinivorans TaxID=3158560 RepID=UPI0033956002